MAFFQTRVETNNGAKKDDSLPKLKEGISTNCRHDALNNNSFKNPRFHKISNISKRGFLASFSPYI
jgi:hypothetical protein